MPLSPSPRPRKRSKRQAVATPVLPTRSRGVPGGIGATTHGQRLGQHGPAFGWSGPLLPPANELRPRPLAASLLQVGLHLDEHENLVLRPTLLKKVEKKVKKRTKIVHEPMRVGTTGKHPNLALPYEMPNNIEVGRESLSHLVASVGGRLTNTSTDGPSKMTDIFICGDEATKAKVKTAASRPKCKLLKLPEFLRLVKGEVTYEDAITSNAADFFPPPDEDDEIQSILNDNNFLQGVFGNDDADPSTNGSRANVSGSSNETDDFIVTVDKGNNRITRDPILHDIRFTLVGKFPGFVTKTKDGSNDDGTTRLTHLIRAFGGVVLNRGTLDVTTHAVIMGSLNRADQDAIKKAKTDYPTCKILDQMAFLRLIKGEVRLANL